jgi:hypothetical protein
VGLLREQMRRCQQGKGVVVRQQRINAVRVVLQLGGTKCEQQSAPEDLIAERRGPPHPLRVSQHHQAGNFAAVVVIDPVLIDKDAFGQLVIAAGLHLDVQ